MPNYYNGTAGNDSFWGTDQDDVFISNGGTDFFYGNGGNDVFHGYAGGSNVTALGGTGNDIYVLSPTSFTYYEFTGEGIDTVVSYANISLPGVTPSAEFENLTLVGAANSGNGNSLANVIRGNLTASNTLEGMDGNDTIFGSFLADTLYGRNHNDLLIGGGDADVLIGGNGIDTAGYGTAKSGVTASLIAIATNTGDAAGDTYTEIEHLSGSAFADRLTGNNSANTLIGGAGGDVLAGGGGADALQGGAGNDVLNGGIGKDRLTGNAGADAFVFAAAPPAINSDIITDYNVAQDTIRLDDAVFTQINGVGTLTSAQFWKSATGLAHDANDRVIYETDTGKLFYDSNGSGAGGRALIAVLSNHAAIGNADIFIV